MRRCRRVVVCPYGAHTTLYNGQREYNLDLREIDSLSNTPLGCIYESNSRSLCLKPIPTRYPLSLFARLREYYPSLAAALQWLIATEPLYPALAL